MSHREGTGQTLSRIKIQSKGTCETLRGSPSKRVAGTVFIATADMNLEGGTAHAAADTQCSNKMGVYVQKQSTRFSKLRTLKPHIRGRAYITAHTFSNTSWQNQLQTLKVIGLNPRTRHADMVH